jgi:anti-sigma B factor antagonist
LRGKEREGFTTEDAEEEHRGHGDNKHGLNPCTRDGGGNSKLVGEPVAAVGDPPTEGEDGEGGEYGPEEGEGEVGDEAQGGEEEPEDFALHGESLAQMPGAKSTASCDCGTSAKRDLTQSAPSLEDRGRRETGTWSWRALGKVGEMRYKAGTVDGEWSRTEDSMAVMDGASSARGFRVCRREVEDGWVVECFGRLTSENVPLLKMEMLEACGKKGRIVLDLKEVPMMDSSGLGAVVTLHVSARTRGCKLEVVNASKQIRELFSMTNVLGLFEETGRHGRRMM